MSRRAKYERRWPMAMKAPPKLAWAWNDSCDRRENDDGREHWGDEHMPLPRNPSPDGDPLALLREAERQMEGQR